MALFTAFGLAALLILSERGVTTEANPNCTAPLPPQDVTARPVSFSCVEVSWMTPSEVGSGAEDINYYNIMSSDTEENSTIVDANTTSYQVTGLTPATTYTFTVYAGNDCNTSQGAANTATTGEVPPVTNVTAWPVSSSVITVNWAYSEPECESVDRFELNYTIDGGTQMMMTVSNVTKRSINIPGLDNKQGTYTINMTAVYQSTASPASDPVMVDFKAPTPPGGLTAMATSGSSITVTWTPPTLPDNRPPVTRYTVAAVPSSGSTVQRKTSSNSTVLSGLQKGTVYTIKVKAINVVGNSLPGESTVDFSAPPPPGGVTAMATSSSSITVTWTPPTLPDNRPPVTGYTVTAVPSSGSTPELLPATATNTVLSGLQRGTVYTIKVVAHNIIGDSSAANASAQTFAIPPNSPATNIGPAVGAAVGVTLAVVCLAAVVGLVLYLILKRRSRRRLQSSHRKGPRHMKAWDSAAQFTDTIRMAIHAEERVNLSGSQQDLMSGQEDSPVSTPILGRRNTKPSHPVSRDAFIGYVEGTAREELMAQYRSIPTKTHDLTALALINPLSNRYINILPYDKNRVVLSEPNSDGNDYINASYIDGYDKEHAFIAAQGPLQRTVDDFWQMVWDQKASVIVMLTKCKEGTKSKCAEYFPQNVNGRVFAKMDIAVVTKSIRVYKDYEVRILEVQNSKAGVTRTIHHFCYLGWPDFGVPESPTGVLTMLHHVRALRGSGDPDAPTITHCSAGVGRTGTFIALDHLVHQVQTEGEDALVDIPALVSTLRTQRGTMVQASEQYVFIHRALREYLLLGYTMLPGSELRSKVEEMSPVKRHSGVSRFQEQYEHLEYITAPYTQLPKVAEDFQSKIRFPDKGPYEGKYIRITPVAGDFSSSFVNASFVDGYRQSKQFIVAQSPMHSTTGDFWALIYEKQSPTILLLCPLQENGKESSVRFWPAEVSHTENFVGYKVTLKGEDVSPSFTTLRLVVQPDAEDLSPLDVTLFHLEDWSAATMPKSGAVLSLLERTRAGQKEGSTSPVVVACNDGLGRSCLFVTLWVLTDQLMMEDQVDVVSAFKAVRASRPGAVDSLDYFIHCYHLLMQYREMHHSMQEE